MTQARTASRFVRSHEARPVRHSSSPLRPHEIPEVELSADEFDARLSRLLDRSREPDENNFDDPAWWETRWTLSDVGRIAALVEKVVVDGDEA